MIFKVTFKKNNNFIMTITLNNNTPFFLFQRQYISTKKVIIFLKETNLKNHIPKYIVTFVMNSR